MVRDLESTLSSTLRWNGVQVYFKIKWEWLSLTSWSAWRTRIRLSAKPRFQQFLRCRRMVRDLETTFSATLSWIWRTGTFQDQMAVAIPKIVECLKDSDPYVRYAGISAAFEISKNGTWSRNYVLCHVVLNMANRCISRSNRNGYPWDRGMPEGLVFVCPPCRDFSSFWDLEEWYVI